MTTATAPPLPAGLKDLLRRLRLPHLRRHAPQIIATAKAQRWEPAEVLTALFAEEVPRPPAFRVGDQTSGGGVPDREDVRRLAAQASSIPALTQQALRTLE